MSNRYPGAEKNYEVQLKNADKWTRIKERK